MGYTQPLAEAVRPSPSGWGDRVVRERRVLGALLHDMALMPQVSDLLPVECLASAFHERLFAALVRRRQMSGAVDLAGLQSDLGVYAYDAEGGTEAALARLVAERAAPDEAVGMALALATEAEARSDRPEPIDIDVVAWSHRQADLLSRLAARSDDLSSSVDWGSVIEEVLHVGRSQTRGVVSKIERIFEHLIKAISDPIAPSRFRWRIEVEAWTNRIEKEATPSMRHLIDLDAAWARGRADAEMALAEFGIDLPRDLPAECPFTYDDLVCGTTFAELLDKLANDRSADPS